MKKQISHTGSALGYAGVLLSAMIFGFTPVLAVISYQGGNNGINMAFLRALLPLPLLYLLARKSARPTKEQQKLGSCLGLLLFGCTLLLYSSYAYIPVGLSTTLHFLYPLYVALYEAVIQKNGLGKKRACGLILGLTGAMLFLDITGETPNPAGLTLAVLSGICYAAYIIVLGKESKNPMPLYRLMLQVSATGAMLCGAVGLAMGRLTFQMTGLAWACALAVAVLVAVFACVLFQAGVRIVGKANAAIFSLLEPITSILFSVLLLNDHLSPAKLAGCVLILSGLFITVLHGSDGGKQNMA